MLSIMYNMLCSNSGRKVLQEQSNQNDERIGVLEEMVKDSQSQASEAERKFEEVGKESAYEGAQRVSDSSCQVLSL